MNAKTTISDNLRCLLKMHDNLSLSDLARATNIPQPTLHHLLDGSTKNPRKVVLEGLANFFEISIPELTGLKPLRQTLPESIKKSLNIASIPLIEWDLLNTWPKTEQAAHLYGQIIIDKDVGVDAFALVSQETTLTPIFPLNSILIFDPEKNLQDRDFILLKLAQNDTVLFNRLFIEKDGFYIKQDLADGNMQLIKIKPEKDKIIGALVEARLQF